MRLSLMSLAEEEVTVCLSRLFALSLLGGALVGSVDVVAFVEGWFVSTGSTRQTWDSAIGVVGQLSPGVRASSLRGVEVRTSSRRARAQT